MIFAWLFLCFDSSLQSLEIQNIWIKILCSDAMLVVNFVRFGKNPTIIPNTNSCNPFRSEVGSIFGVAVVLIFDNSIYSIHFSSKWERKPWGLFKFFSGIQFSNLIDLFSTLAWIDWTFKQTQNTLQIKQGKNSCSQMQSLASRQREINEFRSSTLGFWTSGVFIWIINKLGLCNKTKSWEFWCIFPPCGSLGRFKAGSTKQDLKWGFFITKILSEREFCGQGFAQSIP